jgi:hypothetical protein
VSTRFSDQCSGRKSSGPAVSYFALKHKMAENEKFDSAHIRDSAIEVPRNCGILSLADFEDYNWMLISLLQDFVAATMTWANTCDFPIAEVFLS